jgi:hypothetical protein
MSVQFNRERATWEVRWRDGSRHRKRRFPTRKEAEQFDSVVTARAAPAPTGEAVGLAALETRLAELEARLARADDEGGGQGGVYAYETAQGRRWYFSTGSPTAHHRPSAAHEPPGRDPGEAGARGVDQPWRDQGVS